MADTITLQIDDAEVDALFAKPEGDGPFGGVVVTYHKDGFDGFTHWLVEELARQGFAAISPDHFHWIPEGESVEDRKQFLWDTRLALDLAVARGYLECLPEVDGDRIAIIGHCMGGRTTFLGAACDEHYKAACAWYSGGMFNAQGEGGPSPFERLGDIACPVMGFFGNEDKNPSPEDVDKFDEALTAAGVWHEFHRYDETGHGFMNPDNPHHYVEASAKDSWDRALKFLDRQIGAAAAAAAE
ncbi:MAG: dienelactone hydrolase family protein [Alphaproteobacteria bacterium]|nr:dienelactone hydrolase family protein [Alphaproteobacteria bacterium]